MSSETILIVVIIAMAAVTVAAILKRRPATSSDTVLGAIDPEVLLAPVREQIAAVTSRLENLTTETATARTDITNKIAAAIEESHKVFVQGAELRDTTTRISTALQGTGQRGSWGQTQLKRVVEIAGLTEHVTFKEQVQSKTEDDKNKYPDLVVYLPDNKTIVIDSKAPDLNLANGESTSAKDLRLHIKTLANKKYPQIVPGAMDIVVLFVPSEGTLASALTEDHEIIEFAFEKKVLLVSPMTLLGLLRAVFIGWQQLAQIENVEKINKTAEELCDRVMVLLDPEHFGGVYKGLADAVTSYNRTVMSINSRLMVSVRKLRELGVDVNKGKDPADMKEAPTDILAPPDVS